MNAAPTAQEVTAWVHQLAAAPQSAAGVATLVAVAARLRGWLDGVEVQLAVAAERFASAGGGDGAERVWQHCARATRGEANRVVARAALAADEPVLGAALGCGDITGAHADALARVAGRAGVTGRAALVAAVPALVAEAADGLTPGELERRATQVVRDATADADVAALVDRQRRESFVHTWVDHRTGMHCGRFALDRVRGKALFESLTQELEALWKDTPASNEEPTAAVLERLAPQALVNLVAHGHATRRPTADLYALIDWRTLVEGWHAHSLCEHSDGTELPVGTARRLACNAHIIPVLLGTDGEVLDLGREVRLANRAQRRALRAMYRTCAVPECEVSFERCEIHHVCFFELGGPTDLANLVPLCWRHHHLVHEGGWALELSARRDITLRRPDRTVAATGSFTRAARWPHRRRERPPGHAHRPPGDAPGDPPGDASGDPPAEFPRAC